METKKCNSFLLKIKNEILDFYRNNLKVRKTQEGRLNCVLKNSSFLLKTEHTDQKLSETASEVIIRI